MAPRGESEELGDRTCGCGCGESYTPRQVNQRFKDKEHKERFWKEARVNPLRAYWREQKRKQRAK